MPMSGFPVNLRVRELRQTGPHVYALDLEKGSARLEWLSGQWASLRLPVGPHPPLVRAYSFAHPDWREGPVTLVFDDVPEGVGTDYLKTLESGDEVEVGAVAGKFVLPDPPPAGIVFLARFTGVVPVQCMLMDLERLAHPPTVTLISGAPTSSDFVLHRELAELAERAPWFTYHAVPLDSNRDEVSVLDEIPRFSPDVVPMVSGVRAFTQPVRVCLMERYGYERRAVRVENFD